MSQYPSLPPYGQNRGGNLPYSAGYGQPTWDDGLGSARAAGIMLFIVGGLGIIMSLCLAGIGAMLQQLITQQPEFRQQMGDLPTDMMKIVFLILAGVGVVVSIVFIVLGAFVRKGGMVSAVIALILVVLAELYCVFNMLYSLGKMNEMAGTQLGGAVCATVIPTILLGVLIFVLIKAIGAIRANKSMRMQQQAQMWQYQQMQQAYGQPGYGYPPQAPPPPPPPGYGSNDPNASA